MRRRRIVDGQGDNLVGGADLEQHVGVLAAQVADEVARGLVNAPDGVEGEHEAEGEEGEEGERGHAVATDPPPDLGGESEEGELGHHGTATTVAEMMEECSSWHGGRRVGALEEDMCVSVCAMTTRRGRGEVEEAIAV